MARNRSKAIYHSGYNTNFNRFFDIPAGFPTPETVGYAAPGAFDDKGPTDVGAGPRSRVPNIYGMPVLTQYQSLSQKVYPTSSGDTLVNGLFYGINFANSVNLYRSSVEGFPAPNQTFFTIYEAVPAVDLSSSNRNTTIKLIPGPDFTQFSLGSANPGDSSTPPDDNILVKINIIGKFTNQIEHGYLGRTQNPNDGSIDFSVAPDPPQGPFTDPNGGPDYYVYEIANNNPKYGDTVCPGLFYTHQVGATIQGQSSTNHVVAANFNDGNPGGTVLAQWTNFGYANTVGGGSAGTMDGEGGSRFKNCFIGDATDGPRMGSDLGFTDCLLGPDLGGLSGATPHSDGIQNVGGAHNYPTTGSIWLDFANQQTNGGKGSYASSGYPDLAWVANHHYNSGNKVTAFVLINSRLTPIVAQAKASHTSAASYMLDRSQWTETATNLDLLHLPGTLWTWCKHCTMLGYEAKGTDTYSFGHNHSPFFIPSNNNNAGPVQNFLIWNTYVAGGQNTILDETSVNSDNWNFPKTGQKAPSARGIGGAHGMIVGGNSVISFAPSAGGRQLGTLAVAYSGGTTLYNSGPIAAGTSFTVGTGSNQEQAQASADAVYSNANHAYAVGLTTALANNHSVGEPIINPSKQIGLLADNYTGSNNGGTSRQISSGCFIADNTNFFVGSGSSKDSAQTDGDATYSSTMGCYIVTMNGPMQQDHSVNEPITLSSNGNPGQMLPNLSAATDADSGNTSPILQNGNYNYALQTAVSSYDTQATLLSTYQIAFGKDMSHDDVAAAKGAANAQPVASINNNADNDMITFAPMPSAGRNDVATVTSGQKTITDNAITAWDIGKPVIGTGIPDHMTVLSVDPVNKTFQIASPANANGTSVQIGGAQLTFDYETVTVTQQISTDSSGAYTVAFSPALAHPHSVSTIRIYAPNSNGVAKRQVDNPVVSSETRWRELPRSLELSGDLSGLDVDYNYWGTVTDQFGNLVTLIDAMRNSDSGGWNGWPKPGQRAGEWENTSL